MKERIHLPGPFGFLPPTLTVVLLTFMSVGCRPELPVPSSEPLSSKSEVREFIVRTEPDAPLDAVPRVLRAHVQWSEPIDKERVFLVRGDVSDYHLRQIARDDVSQTLAERMVPAIVWAEDERNVVISPTVVLEPGQTYAVASGEPAKVVHFVVRKAGEAPLLRRVWPTAGESEQFGIYCGDAELPALEVDTRLDPLGPVGRLSRSLAPEGPGRGCLRFLSNDRWDDTDATSWILPPIVEIPGFADGFVQIEPAPFGRTKKILDAIVPLECGAEEVAFGPGCAQVLDDRIAVRAPEGDLLWGIAGEQMDRVVTTAGKGRFLVKGLAPNSEISLDIVTIDLLGRRQLTSFVAMTRPLMAHFILNEVLANPVGPEPYQEWVEIYNDGQSDATLAGYRLLDIGGDATLPDVMLPAGQWAVVVNETYVEDDEVDVPPAHGSLVVRVAALGKNGLSNSGELLRLVDPEGRTISRFPALPKPKAGLSVSRRTPDAPDAPSSYSVTEPTPGWGNVVIGDP